MVPSKHLKAPSRSAVSSDDVEVRLEIEMNSARQRQPPAAAAAAAAAAASNKQPCRKSLALQARLRQLRDNLREIKDKNDQG